DQQVNAYLFLGDLCDPDSGSCVFRAVEVAMSAAALLQKAFIPSFWLAGNHDVIEDGTGDTTLSPLRALSTLGTGGSKVVVAERPCVEVISPLLDVDFVFLPFTATSHRYDVAEFVGMQKGRLAKKTIVAGHLSIPGIIPGEETTEMPRGREVVWPHE